VPDKVIQLPGQQAGFPLLPIGWIGNHVRGFCLFFRKKWWRRGMMTFYRGFAIFGGFCGGKNVVSLW
jgi:hypothetical protein